MPGERTHQSAIAVAGNDFVATTNEPDPARTLDGRTGHTDTR